MLEESAARDSILSEVETGPVVWHPTALALNYYSARDLRGIVDLPEFDNSSMDGYAVRAAEAAVGAKLEVSDQEQPAGVDRHLELPGNSAIRVFTGAPIPIGADAVIMQEDVVREQHSISINEPVRAGENIRRRGGDVCSGQKIISQGDRLTAARLSLLASQGVDEVPVYARPMVHVVTTGDELVQSGEFRLPGQIFDSNGILLKSSIEEMGGIAEQVHVDDNPEQMRHALDVLCQVSDFVVIAGGVSVGDRDFVKQVLQEIGVETRFWKVRVKPGKPFLFGKHPDGCLVFGLPGNPVSAFVTFRLFVAPALLRRLGAPVGGDGLVCQLGVADEEMENDGDRPHYLRAISGEGRVSLSGTQQSHALFGLSKADCLVRLDPGETIAPGETVCGIRL